MVNRFESRGMSRRDAELVVSKMAQYESFFVGLMVSEDLGLQLPEDSDAILLTDAFVMLFSYAAAGAIPVLVYCLVSAATTSSTGTSSVVSNHVLFLTSAGVGLLVLSVLGVVKSTFSSSNWFQAAVESIILGGVCSAAAYFLGYQLMAIYMG